MCEYTAARPESLKDQSSLTGKTEITAIMLIITVVHWYAYSHADTEWEISEAELSLGPQIAKGQCGVSITGSLNGPNTKKLIGGYCL